MILKRVLPLLMICAMVLALPAMASEGGEELPELPLENEAVIMEPVAPVALPYKVYSLDDPATGMAELLTGDGEAATQLPALLRELFGEYTPRTQTVTEYLADGTSVTYQEYVPGVAGMDIPWLAAVGLFGLVVFCVLKLIGGLLKL